MIVPLLLALAALLVNRPAPEFSVPIVTQCSPVFEPGTFIGCEDRDPTQDETDYAGLVWVQGQPSLQTGP